METLILQQIANGFSVGMIYALVALGLTLTFGVLHIVNFAHGEFYMIGGLLAALLGNRLGLPYGATLVIATCGAVVVGVVVDRVAVRPVITARDGASLILITTFAVSIILREGVLAAVGPTPINVPALSGVVSVGPVILTWQRLLIVAMGSLLVVALEMILRKTRFGRSMRAVAQSAFAAQVVGIDVARTRSIAFWLAAGLAGFAGALIVPVGAFDPDMGKRTIISAFVVIVVGSMGSVVGALVCGLALGVFEAVASIGMPIETANTIIYSLLLLVLLVRPQGLFARR